MTNDAMATRQPIVQPTNWAYTIQSNLDQGLPTIALETINGLANPHHVPIVHHLQLLLYLVLEPEAETSISPLALLHRFLDLHGATTLAPLLPSLENKSWQNWPGMAHSLKDRYPRRVRARMESCKKRGIWALVFERTPRAIEEEEAKWGMWREEDEVDAVEGQARKRPKKSRSTTAPASAKPGASRSRSHTRDEDEEHEGYEVVAPRGWVLLSFLLAFWNKDAAENGGVSPAFLSQLWRPSSALAYDQAGDVLEIVRQAVYSTGADALARRRLAAGLLKLLVDAANAEQFLPRSLATALLPLFRDDRAPLLIATLRSLPHEAFTHFLTYAIEDAAGVLPARNAARNGKRRNANPSHFEGPGLSPPKVEYAISLLDHTGPRVHTLELALVTSLATHRPSPLWEDVTDKRFTGALALIAAQRARAEEAIETEPTQVREQSQDSEGSEEMETEPTLPLPRRDSSTPPSLSLSPSAEAA